MNQQSNPAQTEAIRHKDGPMLVLAGPGSGKTYVITNRVKYLIEEHLVPPEEILVITFSRMAAKEMKERFDRLTDKAYPGVTFGTFHACFFHMLQYARGYTADAILRENDALDIIGEILAGIHPEYADDRALVRDVYEEVLKVKCQSNYSTLVESLCNAEESPHSSSRTTFAYHPSSCDLPTFKAVLQGYLASLKRLRKLDFEDMLLQTKKLLTNDPEALDFWRRRFRYLLVDEFQDVNRLQYEIVRLLAGGYNNSNESSGNLFAVGDDDQSIYGFRGSEPRVMLEMPKDMPDCRIVTLPVNYRSTPEIVSAADALIANNRVRYEKDHATAANSGNAVRILPFDTVSSENEFLLSEIASLTSPSTDCRYSDIAILFRTNLQMRSLCDSLSRAGVPFRIRGYLPNLYDDPQVRIALSYLRAAQGDRSRGTILAIANRPKRYVERRLLSGSEISLEALRDQAKEEGKNYLADKVDRLLYDLAMLSRMNPFAAVNYIRKVIGLDSYVAEHNLRGEEALETLAEFQESVKAFTTTTELFESIEAARRKAEQRHFTKDEEDSGDRVSLMTFHASKGLEFSHVYICDCNETIVPHKKALLPESVEEERRLLYVAMTRAKRELTLLYTAKRFGKDLPPSGFLGEIHLPASALQPGTKIIHKSFGTGTVLSLEEDKLRVRFERFLLPKTLSYSLCAKSMLVRVL